MTDKRILPDWLNYDKRVGDVLSLQTFGDAEAVFAEKRQTLEDSGFRQPYRCCRQSPEVLLQAEKS